MLPNVDDDNKDFLGANLQQNKQSSEDVKSQNRLSPPIIKKKQKMGIVSSLQGIQMLNVKKNEHL